MSTLPHTLSTESTVPLDRAIFKLTGPDAAKYLNGQISQDISLATETIAPYSITATFKGKLEADFFIRLYKGEIIIDTTLELRETLFNRLDRYIIADDCELTDITDQLTLHHTFNPKIENGWQINRFGQPGTDSLEPQPNTTLITHEEIEKVRITHLIPKWGAELTPDTLPAEASVETRAISFTKGCYTGQEVISRMKSAGKTNKHLILLKLDSPIKPRTPLLTETSTIEKPSAIITSTCTIENTHYALAYRTRKHQETNTFQSPTGTTATTIKQPNQK